MTGGLWQLGLAVALFLVSHSLANRPAIRRPAERLLGRAGFIAVYSAVSLLLLAWMIAAVRAAPIEPVWPKEPWTLWVPALVMPVAGILAVAGMTSPNPFSIGPGARGYDPARPGILRVTRHPVPWSFSLWAGAHMVPNGDVAGLMLFAPLLVLALAGPALLDGGRRRALGEVEWRRLAAATGRPSALSAALRETGGPRIAGGLALYAILVALHPLVIGLSPLP
ncbi:MAG: NnrU family protein [Magnetospirillum sp.]|nr:NnrU family protein [Magnetospirillum sp.]